MKSQKKVLITGASGFVGSYLISFLSADPTLKLFCIGRRSERKSDAGAVWLECNFDNIGEVAALITEIDPDEIYHLVGSFTNNYGTDYSANVLAAKHILDALILKPKTRVLLIGSAAEYGSMVPADAPVAEDYPLRPTTIYGLTKTYQTYLMDYYYRVHNLNIVMARIHSLFGKGASSRLFVGSVYEQAEKYKRGELALISVGNLDSERDFIDVKQAVMHLKEIMEHGIAGEAYNVGSGKATKMYDILQQILKEVGVPFSAVEIKKDRETRAVSKIYADIKKLQQLTKSA